MTSSNPALSLEKPILHYDFSRTSSTIVSDLSQSGFAGVIRGHDRGGAFLKEENVFGQDLTVLHLTGGPAGGFLQLPDGVTGNKEGLTVSFYAMLHSLANYGTLFSFGKDHCFYLSVLPDADSGEQVLISPGATGGGRSQEASLEKWLPFALGKWYHIILTFDNALPSLCTLYLDGQKAGSFQHRRMSSLDLQDCVGCYFGYGELSRNPLALSVADIRLFGCALSEDAIPGLFHIAPDTRLSLEAERLGRLFERPLCDFPSLPSQGYLGAAITWQSKTPDVISDDGIFIRPCAGSVSKKAVLEAAIRYGDCVRTFEYPLEIAPLPSDEAIVSSDLESVSIPFPGHITENIPLPSSGPRGSAFTWKSSDPDCMDSEGHIRRPAPEEGHAKVILTLTACCGASSGIREFQLTVLPCYAHPLPGKPYLPAAPFTGSAPVKKAAPAAPYCVQLTGSGVFPENQKRTLDYLTLLDADRMLYNFRRAFGLDTKNALPPGGWEEPAGLLRGHSTGHFLSALAFAYAATKEETFRSKAEYMIHELFSMQQICKGAPASFQTGCAPSHAPQSLWSREPEKWGKGFVSAYSPDQFALLEQFTPYATIWAPYYTLHKILAGLLDCYELLGMEDALRCAGGIGDWVYERLCVLPEKQRAKMWKMYIAGEYGGMNESLARLYRQTGQKRYLEAAQMFDNPGVFDGLIHGRDTISGIHANQHIPQIIGALQEFEATSDPKYYVLARNFWELVTNHYMYSIGGVGRGENFKEPDVLAGNIEGARNCETCATYNLLKLTGMLYRYAPDHGVYMDYYERALVNHIAASQNPKILPGAHQRVTYMLPIGPGARKEYGNDYEDFTCCHGTGMENHVRYTEQIYHTGEDQSLYVNLFLSSRYDWAEKGLSVIQECDFPATQSRLIFHTKEKADCRRLKLHIRIPYWCRDTFALSLNGEALGRCGGKESYYTLERDFADGDELLISLPYALHLCYTGDCREGLPAASLMYGPLVMNGLSEQKEWITLHLPPVLENAFEIAWDRGPVLLYDDLKFIPSYQTHDTAYHTYFKIDLC